MEPDKDLVENGFHSPGKTLTFNFATEEAANHFKSWLCGSGEQGYWEWMKCREDEEEGSITGLEFDYWAKDIIEVRCGRLDLDT